MSQSKLQQLTKYLIDARYQGHKLAHASQFDSWIEGGRIETAGTKVNGNGLIAARFYYSGVISINPCNAPSALIGAFVSCWIQANGGKYDSDEAEFSSDTNDDNSFDIELTIEQFYEEIELIEKENGPFVLNNTAYDFGEQSLWIAEQFTLNAEVKP
jgi:hypothetical protein